MVQLVQQGIINKGVFFKHIFCLSNFITKLVSIKYKLLILCYTKLK